MYHLPGRLNFVPDALSRLRTLQVNGLFGQCENNLVQVASILEIPGVDLAASIHISLKNDAEKLPKDINFAVRDGHEYVALMLHARRVGGLLWPALSGIKSQL